MYNGERRDSMKKLFVLFALVFCMVFVNDKQVYAASYKEICLDDENPVVQTGKYYLKYTSGHIYVSRSKYGDYVKTPLQNGCHCNGKQAYYINRAGKVLYQYNLETKKSKRIKRIISAKKNFYASIGAVYEGKIYLTCDREDEHRYDTYIYSISKKKVIKKIKDCNITASKGKYAVSEPYYDSDDYYDDEEEPRMPIILYRFTSSGLKKVKQLSDYGEVYGFVKGKLYYIKEQKLHGTCYPEYQVELYRCSANGNGKKKIATFISKTHWVCILEVTSTYCKYWEYSGSYDSGLYKYTYKTKKTKKIADSINMKQCEK